MLYDPRYALDEVGRSLLAAADLIEDKGWCQRHFTLSDGRVCLVQALNAVSASKEAYVYLVSRLRTRWQRMPRGGHDFKNYLAHWNDRRQRTREEVLGVLRIAASERAVV